MARFDIPDEPVSRFSDDSDNELVSVEAARARRRSRPVHPLFAAATARSNDNDSTNGYSRSVGYVASEHTREAAHISRPIRLFFGGSTRTDNERSSFVLNSTTATRRLSSSSVSVAGSDNSDISIDKASESSSESEDTSSHGYSSSDESDELDQDEYGDINSYAELRSLPLENLPRTHIRNPLVLDKSYLIGSDAFKNQCGMDWDELPFTTKGELCPTIKFGANIPAMIWKDPHGPHKEIIKMSYLDSTFDRIGHYVDTKEYHAELEFIEKIKLKQFGLFNVEFSIFWKVPLGMVGRRVAGSYSLAVLRHNLLAPDAYASLEQEHRRTVILYVLYNWNKYWGAGSWYDLQ
ncbi:hypothetical protein M422DRAFT_52666 [Sphaerobolus stellatus SS14]|uniref:Unplaced genomic scaffold SPHSTscaffold_145, whole genome shotgun sequence n=1 Tax=Sphaerobolus stellatus (strain SS14) TaxID=990650 RepID=A0A0C9TRY3_SPHS4|nr:hypothetical protein M422DRAFT_52666 [Sphaerobolus stellatus SS14]